MPPSDAEIVVVPVLTAVASRRCNRSHCRAAGTPRDCGRDIAIRSVRIGCGRGVLLASTAGQGYVLRINRDDADGFIADRQPGDIGGHAAGLGGDVGDTRASCRP